MNINAQTTHANSPLHYTKRNENLWINIYWSNNTIYNLFGTHKNSPTDQWESTATHPVVQKLTSALKVCLTINSYGRKWTTVIYLLVMANKC